MIKRSLFILLTLILLAIIGSLVQNNFSSEPTVNLPKMEPDNSGDAVLDSLYTVINDRYQQVKPILARSCFDCHSTSVNYPWYHALPGVKTVLDDHVKEGLDKLNLSYDFPFKSREPQIKLLGEIKEEIEDDEMPILGYRLLHWGKLIKGDDREKLFNWIDSARASLASYNSGMNETPVIENELEEDTE